MSHTADTDMLLVAGPAIRRAQLWTSMDKIHFRAYGQKEFTVRKHLSTDIPVLLYQIDARFSDTLRFIDKVSKTQSDLCVIVLGHDIGSDRVARLLRHGAFDYLTWPCSAARLSESIVAGLRNRRTFLEVRNLSDELARTNVELAKDRAVLTQCNRNLSALNHLMHTLAGSLETDAIVRALFAGLPQLIPADLIGLVRTNPEQAWSWSQSRDDHREAMTRAHLLSRLGCTRSHSASTQKPFHPMRASHLSLVPPMDRSHVDVDAVSVSTHDVPLVMGLGGSGMLHVERGLADPFTDREKQLLATLGASLALTLRNSDTHRQLHELALRDPLTDVLNRRALDGPLTRELKTGLRYGTPACLLLLDLDYFKTVNDRLGHPAGDGVLKQVAALVQETVRDTDSVGRYGGEEFAVVLPHTALEQAETLAERIRLIIEGHPFELEDGHVRITASIGVASLRDSAIGNVEDWIAAADSALYQAKAQGRNQVVTHMPGRSAPAQAAALFVAA